MEPEGPMTPGEEHEIGRRMAAGDHRAVGELMAGIQGPLRGYLSRYLGYNLTACDLEEVIQDSFIRAQRSIVGFRFESSLKTWLFRIGSNLCLNRIDSNRRRGQSVCLDDGQWIDESADFIRDQELAEYQQRISSAISRMSPHEQRILELRGRGNDYQEIAWMMGLEVGTVKSRLCRVRLKLREMVAE